MYAVYLVTVKKVFADGTHDSWDVYRRYSDFYDIHTTILEKVRFGDYTRESGFCGLYQRKRIMWIVETMDYP